MRTLASMLQLRDVRLPDQEHTVTCPSAHSNPCSGGTFTQLGKCPEINWSVWSVRGVSEFATKRNSSIRIMLLVRKLLNRGPPSVMQRDGDAMHALGRP